MSRLTKFLSRIVIGLIILLAIGALYQRLTARRDLRQFPSSGRLVDVNGKNMHLNCKGTGSPTIILESGLGGNWLDWAAVQDELAQETQTCAYDRLGAGWSDLADEPQSAENIVANLHTLLQNADVAPPYIFVGHSAGGRYGRLFARTYPDEISGLVLVDSAVNETNSTVPLPEAIANDVEAFNAQLQLCQYLAPFGILRLVGLANSVIEERDLTDVQRDQLLAMINQTQSCAGNLAERKGYSADAWEEETPLGDLPLIVLVRGIGDADLPEEERWPDIPLSQLQALDAEWERMQSELATLSTNSQFIIAEESEHFIHYDQPELVIEAVQSLITE